jgi:phage shock protein A
MEERRTLRTSEVGEQLEAQRRIVESLKGALKSRVDEVEDARKFLSQGVFDTYFRKVDIPLPRETESTLPNLIHAVEAAISKIEAEIVSVSSACANERLERLEKERGVVLLGERAARAEDAVERVKTLETKRAELKNKVDYQAHVLEALRDRINYLQRAAQSSGPTSPLLGETPAGVCGNIRQRCLRLSNYLTGE